MHPETVLLWRMIDFVQETQHGGVNVAMDIFFGRPFADVHLKFSKNLIPESRWRRLLLYVAAVQTKDATYNTERS